MADVRTLLQREREARRIQHPHLSYSKSGALTCIICNLNVKSEALWEGHLKSANHRKNLRDAATNTNGAGNGKKRKIEEVIEEENPRKRKPAEDEEAEGEGRKKRQVSFQIDVTPVEDPKVIEQTDSNVLPGFVKSEATAPQPTPTPTPSPPDAPTKATTTIDEDEWAAFEAEVAPLARPQAQDYADATISAAPVSAEELAAQQAATSQRSRREQEADDEREESEQRLADEFDVMEEMEERIRKLKEKREALRVNVPVNPTLAPGETMVEAQEEEKKPPESESESESDGEDEDDWFS